MFRNPTIVQGFPILARDNDEQGLELPLNMLLTLADVQFLTCYDGTEDSKYDQVDWACVEECKAGIAIEQKLTIAVSKYLGASFAFVRGTRDKPEIFTSDSYSKQIGFASQIRVKAWLVDGASALLHIALTQIAQARIKGEECRFNDESFNPSKFNYATCEGDPDAALAALRDETNKKHKIFREFDSYACEKTNVKPVNAGEIYANILLRSEAEYSIKELWTITSFKDVVSSIWGTLEQMYDRQLQVATAESPKPLQNPFKNELQGYEFMDIVSAQRTVTLRSLRLQENGVGWLRMVKSVDVLTLFGKNFGDLYQPTNLVEEPICAQWTKVPPGKEYLAVPISLLKSIKRESQRRGQVDVNSNEITKDILWTPSKDAFKVCRLDCNHDPSGRVQKFRCVHQLSSGNRWRINQSPFDGCAHEGAVLFAIAARRFNRNRSSTRTLYKTTDTRIAYSREIKLEGIAENYWKIVTELIDL
ncbi:hypothetical protein N0V83_006769 [Neocucurbitaria cava]|uniref:Uncharacterized protein n=1 Tax=Neocucurbitaria cava TaxID=798079 RepID=A0A9W8Y6R8_9PLEO|nr:hypothetical protein N0V83_006769 [Neocucurbitaria cava]